MFKVDFNKKHFCAFMALFFAVIALQAQTNRTVSISVDVNSNRKVISPSIYGKNNCLADDPGNPSSNYNAQGQKPNNWAFFKNVGLRFMRDGGGNNSTKYNWRTKMSSHPDWYNNVFSHDWAYATKLVMKYMPTAKVMWSFQLLGYAATTKTYNYNEASCDPSHARVKENLCGLASGTDCTQSGISGDPNTYLKTWPADSTVAILDYFFSSASGQNLDQDMLQYWNMDNEPEWWASLHNDVDPALTSTITAEQYMQRYFNVAIKARQKFPNIKLVGPVTTNESLWFQWNGSKITYKDTSYTWIEYFIKRVGEKQDSTGLRLLDVLDFHFYPGAQNGGAYGNVNNILNFHRVWFDSNYVYPYSTGLAALGVTNKKVFIWNRCKAWLKQHLGENHGVTFGLSEAGTLYNGGVDANVVALWYASHLGTFAQNNVEIFAPWDWYPGMWETMHLFSRYGQTESVKTISASEVSISGYGSINHTNDSLTVILVNRSSTSNYTATISVAGFQVPAGVYSYYQLANLPTTETFVSHTDNALTEGSITVTGTTSSVAVKVPPFSITALVLTGNGNTTTSVPDQFERDLAFNIAPNPAEHSTVLSFALSKPTDVNICVSDLNGKQVYQLSTANFAAGKNTFQLDMAAWAKGVYFCTLNAAGHKVTKKIIVL